MFPTKANIVCMIIFNVVYYPYSVQAKCDAPNVTSESVNRIFAKYGEAQGNGVINKTRINDLLKALALDKVQTICAENDRQCKKNRLHMVAAANDPMSKRRKRRSVSADKSPVEDKHHEEEMEQKRNSCKIVREKLHDDFRTGLEKSGFIKVCPLLVEKIADKACIHYHKRYPQFVPPEAPPGTTEKWGYGLIAITICSLLSLCVIAMIPCLQKSFYDAMMAYLVALAVGTLCGDALLHLIPHAFIEGANMAAGLEVDEHQAEAQHLSQVYRALVVMGGIYLFFVVEQLMKIKSSWSKRHSHSHDTEMVNKVEEEDAGAKLQEEILVETGGHSHAPSGHAHSHGDKNITGETNISSIAWMVVVGDGFHNFSDGLAVGAAFSASISSGVSTTIAIFCHELPHELGDFAILIKAGMTAKQAIVYNLVGAILSYFGLAIGILAGTNDLGRHIILCLTAGLFLYISLVNMMTEVAGKETDTFHCSTILCQHLGMLSGIAIMLVISIYEHEM